VNIDTIRVLLVEDEAADAYLLSKFLSSETDIDLTHVESLDDAIRCLNTLHFDAVLLDLSLPDSRGISTVQQLHKAHSEIPILVLTGLDDENTAIAALREGAQDYLIKGEIQRSWLVRAIYYAIERQQTLDKLQQLNQDLARSNQELEQFAYVVSHDLRQPLQGILGFASVIDMMYRDRLDDNFKKYIDHIHDTSQHMSRLIQDLLDYSTVGSSELCSEPTDCKTIVENVLINLSTMVNESNAVITMDELPQIKMQETHSLQLFQNLLSNALKYRHSERIPTIHISFQAQSHPSSSQESLFGVQDNGLGIESEYFDQIFQIFKRLHTRDEFSGTGIGLATCKKIVEHYGGKIWVESTPSCGSTFYFTLPQDLIQ